MNTPYRSSIVAFVTANPGCCKFDVAKHCTWHPRRNPSYQYYLVNTAIRHGWIRAEKARGRYYLYPAH